MPLKTPNYKENQTYNPADKPEIEFSAPPMATATAGIELPAAGALPAPDSGFAIENVRGEELPLVETPAQPRPIAPASATPVPQPPDPEVDLVGLYKRREELQRAFAEPTPRKLRPVPLGLTALMLAVDAVTGKPQWLNMLLFDRPAKQRQFDADYERQRTDWERKKPLYENGLAIINARVQQAQSRSRIVSKSSAERSYVSAKVGLENIKARRKNAATAYANRLEEAEATYQRNIEDGADEKLSRGKADMARMTAVNDYNLALDTIGYINESKYQEIINKARIKLKELGVDPITIDAQLMPDINQLQPNSMAPQGGAGSQQGGGYSGLSDDELISSLNRELGSEVA